MYCGIDIGTSSMKCLLVDRHGAQQGFGRSPVSLVYEKGRYLVDTDSWALALKLCLGQALAEYRGKASDIRALAISGNGPTLVAVDGKGKTVGKAVSWMDRTAVDEAKTVSKAAGFPVDPSFYLPKAIRALAEAGGDGIRRFFSGPEYLAYTLGAEPVSYKVNDFYEPYLWCTNAASALGIDGSLFPPYVLPTTRIGSVSARAARTFGLAEGTPIVSAFPDFLAALVGSGTVVPGMVCDRAGSSEALNLCSAETPGKSPLFCLPHAIDGLWNLSGGVSTSGKAVEWYARAAGYDTTSTSTFYEDAMRSVPGANGLLFLPYLRGERAPLWNPRLRASFVGLDTRHTREDMARAVLEGICFGLKKAYGEMDKACGLPKRIRCSGGPARNELLCQMKSDILCAPMEVPVICDTEPLGDAAACAVALGDHASLVEASAAMVRIHSSYVPDARTSSAYAERYAEFERALQVSMAYHGDPAPAESGRT